MQKKSKRPIFVVVVVIRCKQAACIGISVDALSSTTKKIKQKKKHERKKDLLN